MLVDTASETVAGAISLFTSLPGDIALTPDGSRAYVGIQSIWVNTGYGAGFFWGRHALVIDTITSRIAGVIDFGADGPNFTEQNTPSGIGVTPDRRAVYASIPRLGSVAMADVNTNAVSATIPVGISPGDLAIVPNATTPLLPYAVDATDDSATVSTAGGTAVANVLANDRLGGIAVTLSHVSIAQQSSSSDSVALDPATGAVIVAPGAPLGSHVLVYRACERAAPSNCDDATVTVTVRLPFVIDAVADSGSTTPGWTALANVLANDTLDGAPATLAGVTLSQVSSSNAGVTLNVSSGAVLVAAGTQPGAQTLTYRICEIASPSNCDVADGAVTVVPFAIDAVNDTGAAPRTGGLAVASVLSNDTFANGAATLATVRLSQVSSTNAGVALNAFTGAVTGAAGTPVGSYTLRYRLCEIATPSNCDEATVTVAVQQLLIGAVNDSGRGSSKAANTVIASVLRNDILGNAAATTATVRLRLVSLTPANSQIALDLTDGSVDVRGKTSSGTFALVYEICEIAAPANCAQATAAIDLSGK